MRYQYGQDGGAVVTDAAGNAITGRPGTVWTTLTGGSQVTDLVDLAGVSTGGTVTTDSRGRVLFQGPDAVTATLWWDGGDGTRWAIAPTEPDRIARQQVEQYGVLASAVGSPGGVAGLDGAGTVPQAQLPDLSASYLPVPPGGQPGDSLVRGATATDTSWARLTSGTVAPWSSLDALPGPRWVAHRGAALLAPENTIEAIRMSSALAADAVEIDVFKTIDGGLFVMHDGTVDRTSNLTGNSASMTIPTALRGRIDAGSWFANTWPSDLRIPLFADVLAETGNTIPIIVHCGNAGSGALAVQEIQRQEMDQSVLIMAWNETELAAARTAGIPSLLLDADGVLAGQTYAGLIAAGTTYLGVDYAQASNATIQAAAAAGLRVMVYTVNRRSHFAALPTDGSVWAVISDDPWYVRSTSAMRAADLFTNGTFFHGMPGIVDAAGYRGFFQSPSWYGLDTSGTALDSNNGYVSVLQGYLGPLPSTFTLNTDFVMDAVDAATASMQIMLGVGDKEYDDYPTGSQITDGYNVLMRQSGIIDVYRVTGGVVTNIGTLATAAITTGTTRKLRIQVTATQIIVSRPDIVAPNTLTITNNTYRGNMYPHLGVRDAKVRWSALAIS
ncbi:glycerophosphodiester phosphodiesterase family protein [Streptomyces sp. NPDC006798]|uniref:glycerophosphodiester phosphodiesterase n=1 Tax=unclassified Streptomyces TaxID=2593676 RepID=UPI00331BC7EC